MSLHDEIAKLAYELYEKSGRIDGRDTENWHEAERIIRSRRPAQEKDKPREKAPALPTRRLAPMQKPVAKRAKAHQ